MNSLARVAASAALRTETAIRAPAEQAGIAVVSDPRSIEAEWRRFEASAAGHVFQTFDVIEPWLHHVGADRGVSPRIVIGRGEGGGVLFLLPFGIRRCLGARVLQWLGDDHADYHAGLFAPHFLASLAADPDGGRAFVELIVGRFEGEADAAYFRRQPASIAGYPNPFAAWHASPHLVRSHRTKLAGSWDAYYRSKRNSGSRRHDRLKWQKMETLGPVTIIDAETPAEIRHILKALFAQKQQSLATRGVPNMFASQAVRDFYEAVALKPYPHGPSHVSAIECDGEIVAANWGLVRGNRYYYVLTSYATGPAARWSPGGALMRHLMRWSIDRGLEEFDFTIGDEDFKERWCEETESLYDSYVLLNPRGLLFWLTLRAEGRAKRMVKASPRLTRFANYVRSRLATRRG